MTVTVMPPDRRVSGTEHITYLNNSPDTLPGLVIKLFQNYHKPGAPRVRRRVRGVPHLRRSTSTPSP